MKQTPDAAMAASRAHDAPINGIYTVSGRSVALAGGNKWSAPGQSRK
jgi:hypothetical protein